LLIAGGGPTVPAITAKAFALAGGKDGSILIVPLATRRHNPGQRTAQLWRAAGATRVSILNLTDRKAALAAVKDADLIWMPGGSQSRLMELLRKNDLVEALRTRYLQGATVGGTSAGAAVMSRIMLTRTGKGERLSGSAICLSEGLGLWPGVIVDTHFFRRNRSGRLLTAVLHHPANVGIGIDESTAVVVTGRSFEVIGRSGVLVVDARKGATLGGKDRDNGAATNVALRVLRAGMKYDLTSDHSR
jgi:cyanophycinase